MVGTIGTELSKNEEGYIETIHALINEYGFARVADIANALDIKPPSVTSMLKRLDGRNFVKYTRYRGVILTTKGTAIARRLNKRHRALKDFLILLGVPEESAEADACEMEHKINPETIIKISKFVEFVQTAPNPPPFLLHFRKFERTGKRPDHCKSTQK
ncbi:MAG: metal-dependent transcriptional regulator [Candidatus Bathyarchaeota archaeon]|nr:MAG: metal-dependent transcriptional regulator [Candidatus Bathyarchaeota archaeon]